MATLPHQSVTLKTVRKAWRRMSGLRWEGLTPAVLHEYLDQTQTDLCDIHLAVASQYFHLYLPAVEPSGHTQTQTQTQSG